MCHFITGIIYKETKLELINSIGTKYNIIFSEVSNEHISKQLNPDQNYIGKNSKYCDCGTALGAIAFIEKDKKSNEKDLTRLRKKGWSTTKISNWLENKKRSDLKDERAAKHKQGNYEYDAENWIKFLTELSKNPGIGYFGVLFHWYSSGVESERVELLKYEQLKICELSPDYIYRMEEDTVYELTGKGA
ncbi:MAG: hypothetical protein WBA74_02560 [Cyclobacteriaceae bacterium]